MARSISAFVSSLVPRREVMNQLDLNYICKNVYNKEARALVSQPISESWSGKLNIQDPLFLFCHPLHV